MKTNSQVLLSSKLYIGDVDGDTLDELIAVDGMHVSFFKANGDHTPVVEQVFPAPVERLIVGDFVSTGREHGKDQLLGILADGSTQGYAISDDRQEMWWWFTQPTFIQRTDHYVVGDFDGDGADEILVYGPSTGALSIYGKRDAGFTKLTGWSLGNLGDHDRTNKLLIAGNFGQTAGRADLLLIDQATGQVKRFDTVTDRGVNTFWWAFTTNARLFGSQDDLCVANLGGGSKDGLVIRSSETGRFGFCALEYRDGGLAPAAVDAGQLPVKPKTGRILAAKVRDAAFRREPGGTLRDDILFFDGAGDEFIRTDARHDPATNRLTYWWAYTTNLIVEPQIQPSMKPWAVMLCRFKGDASDRGIEDLFRQIFTPGSGGLIEYWHDISLGAVDISQSRIFGWIELDLKREDAAGKDRSFLIDAAIGATKKAGYDPVKGFHSQIAVFTHNFSKDGAPPDADWRDPVWGRFWIDGSADGQGRVSAPPHMHSGTALGHEMGHGFGFQHDLYPDLKSQYGDPDCIMSAANVYSFQHPRWNRAFGPSMSLPQISLKGWMYERRVRTVEKTWVTDPAGIVFDLASISDHRMNALLGVILPSNTADAWNYYLEYMMPTAWNRGLKQSRLVVRRHVRELSAFLGEIVLPGKLGEQQTWIEPSGKVEFRIERIRDDQRSVRVSARKLG